MKFIFKCLIIMGITVWLPIYGFVANISVGTKENLGKIAGAVDVELLVQGPAAQVTPLQIICVFEYTEGDITTSPPALPKELNGLLHVDEALHGLITDLRKSNKFQGKLLETLLITSPANTISPQKLLLIGLGNRNNFKPEIMKLVGITGMREALRLGVSSYSHASDLKDAGIDSPTADIAGYVVRGAADAYQTQMFLFKQNASSPLTVKKLTLLSGPAYFEDSKNGINKVITSTDIMFLPTISNAIHQEAQKTQECYLFSYGGYMDQTSIQEDLKYAPENMGVYKLDGYEFYYNRAPNKTSAVQSTGGNIMQEDGKTVYGVLWKVKLEDFTTLDAQEQVPELYRRYALKVMNVNNPEISKIAQVYIAHLNIPQKNVFHVIFM